MRRALLLLSTLTLAAACGDASRSVGPVMGNVPGFAISDGANTGGGPANGDFFFLPPMVPDPSGSLTYDAGAFDAGREPRVEICRLTTVEPRLCAESIRTFSAAEVAVSTADEQYQVNWHTDEDNLGLDQLYRIQVQIPRHEHDGVVHYHTLGYADVDPVNSGKELKNVATGEVIGLVDGRTLPIKFRIERSPRCEGSDDCVEAVVSDEGGRVETETGYAIAEFSEGWLPDGFDEVVVAIRRVPIGGVGQDASCHGTAHVQYEGCYDFETFPDVGTFAAEVVISTCIEPDAGAVEPVLQLAASDEGQNFRILPPRIVDIECEGFTGTDVSDGPVTLLDRIGRRALALGTRIGLALAPRPLYAVDKGRGGAIDDFSHGGWVLPGRAVLFDPAEGPITVAPLSTRIVRVRVMSDHDAGELHTPVPLPDFTVHFSVSTDGGTLGATSAITNADGVATIVWTLPGDGQHTLTALAAGSEVPATLVANVLSQLPTSTTIGGRTLIRDGESPFIFATVSGTPGAGEDAQVSFYEGETLIETVPLNDEGEAFLTRTDWALRKHTLTAVFEGTPTLLPSTSGVAEIDVLRQAADIDGFLGAIDGERASSEGFDALPSGSIVSTIIDGLLDVTSPFDLIEVRASGENNFIFGIDEEGNPTRSAGEGRYDLDFLQTRSAIAFDITSKDPRTGPMFVEVHTASGAYTFAVQNVQLESDPVFFSVLASAPITRVVVVEGPELGGSIISEETGLDAFHVGFALLDP